MNTNMKTKLTALVTAAAIVAAGFSAAPAQADPAKDLVKFMVGAAFLGAVLQANNPNVTVTTSSPGPYYRPRFHKPRVCLRQRWTRRGWVRFYSQRCLANHGWRWRHGRWVRVYW